MTGASIVEVACFSHLTDFCLHNKTFVIILFGIARQMSGLRCTLLLETLMKSLDTDQGVANGDMDSEAGQPVTRS